MTAKECFEISAKSILGECTCGEMYLSRKLTAPDCVWCNYGDMVIESLKDTYNLAININEEDMEMIELTTKDENSYTIEIGSMRLTAYLKDGKTTITANCLNGADFMIVQPVSGNKVILQAGKTIQ